MLSFSILPGTLTLLETLRPTQFVLTCPLREQQDLPENAQGVVLVEEEKLTLDTLA